MKAISIDEDAFYELLDVVGEYLQKRFAISYDQWITDTEAMRLLNIKSKTTLQKLRDQGSIRFSQPQKKILLYDRHSILEYIEQHTRNVYRKE